MKNMHHRSSGYGALPPTQGRDQVGFLLSALQESRRQQAVRIISRYRHVVHEPPGSERPKMIQKRKTEADEVSQFGKPKQRRAAAADRRANDSPCDSWLWNSASDRSLGAST